MKPNGKTATHKHENRQYLHRCLLGRCQLCTGLTSGRWTARVTLGRTRQLHSQPICPRRASARRIHHLPLQGHGAEGHCDPRPHRHSPKSPLKVCQNVVQYNSVAGSADLQLHRNSPVAVNVSAVLSQAVGDGVTVELSVKYSVIPIKIINRKDPMCSLIGQIGLECPFEAGPISFQKEVMVPDRFIPAVRCCNSRRAVLVRILMERG